MFAFVASALLQFALFAAPATHAHHHGATSNSVAAKEAEGTWNHDCNRDGKYDDRDREYHMQNCKQVDGGLGGWGHDCNGDNRYDERDEEYHQRVCVKEDGGLGGWGHDANRDSDGGLGGWGHDVNGSDGGLGGWGHDVN